MQILFRILLVVLSAVIAGCTGAVIAAVGTYYVFVLLSFFQPELLQVGWIFWLFTVPLVAWHSAVVAGKSVWNRTDARPRESHSLAGSADSIKSAAEIVLTNLQRAHPPVHRFREVEGALFAHVSHRFYRRTTTVLEELGFSMLGDIEDVTLRENTSPDPRTFVRTMVSADQTTIAAFYHVAPTFLWRLVMLVLRLPSKFVDFESVTLDGTYQTTSNSPASIQVPRPDSICADCAPHSLSVADLYRRHLDNLRTPKGLLRRVGTVGELIDLQVEQHARIRAHLEAIGWVTPGYLRAQGIRESDIDAVHDEVQRLLDEDFAGDPRPA